MWAAVIFDLDGVLVDSESAWDTARREFVARHGGTWTEGATRAVMGMSSVEWSRYIHDELGVGVPPPAISRGVVALLQDSYRERIPLIPGAREAVRRLAAQWRLGLASSSNREIIDLVLDQTGMAACFAATVSSEEVARGKPAPDVYLEAARRLGAEPSRCVAIEDSSSGLRSAAAAQMHVVAIPNATFPPDDDALSLANTQLAAIDALTVDAVRRLPAVAERIA